MVQNRWKQYSTVANEGKPLMDLDLFLAVLHDRMIPSYIRQTIDSLEVNVPMNQVVQAAQRLFASDNRSAGTGPTGHESDDFKEDNWRISGDGGADLVNK